MHLFGGRGPVVVVDVGVRVGVVTAEDAGVLAEPVTFREVDLDLVAAAARTREEPVGAAEAVLVLGQRRPLQDLPRDGVDHRRRRGLG
jgi:hypothetical protein